MQSAIRYTLVLAFCLELFSCRSVPEGSELRHPDWDMHVIGVDGAGSHYAWRRADANASAKASAYVFLIDRRCRLVTGELWILPWQAHELPEGADAELIEYVARRERGLVEPKEPASADGWHVPANGGLLRLPPGTWSFEARAKEQPLLRAPDHIEWSSIRVTLEPGRETAVVFYFHHDRLVRRRCFAGDQLDPTTPLRREFAAPCTDATDSSCPALTR